MVRACFMVSYGEKKCQSVKPRDPGTETTETVKGLEKTRKKNIQTHVTQQLWNQKIVQK